MMSRQRGWLEKKLDEHNHKMELLRTLFGFIAAIGGIAGMLVFLKVFGWI